MIITGKKKKKTPKIRSRELRWGVGKVWCSEQENGTASGAVIMRRRKAAWIISLMYPSFRLSANASTNENWKQGKLNEREKQVDLYCLHYSSKMLNFASKHCPKGQVSGGENSIMYRSALINNLFSICYSVFLLSASEPNLENNFLQVATNKFSLCK